MSDRDCEAVLRGMLPELKRKEIDRIIEDNFYAIRDDIRRLVDLECRPPGEDGGPGWDGSGTMGQSFKPASE